MPRKVSTQTCFKRDLQSLLNRYSIENESDTPDYMLAHYLVQCLEAFELAVRARETWYGRPKPKKSEKRGEWRVPPREVGDPYKVPPPNCDPGPF